MKDKEKPSSSRRQHWIGCDIEADYFGEERKSAKMARKIATSKDRSKYKKTDQRQQAKRQQAETAKEYAHAIRGRVLSIASQGIVVEADGKTNDLFPTWVLKKEKTHVKNLITVGDFVLFEPISPNEGMILQVEPRRSILSRAENLSRRKEQLIAANIDQVIITISVVSPALKPSLIDRYIIAAQKGEMIPLVAINKIDLLDSSDVDENIRKEEKMLFQELLEAYRLADILVIPISTIDGKGLTELKQAMQNKTSVFAGQSGVGKSSLINAITGRDLKVGDLTSKTNKGAHTTTMAQLLPLEFGGWCVDTPGIKSFGVWDLDKEEIEQYFPEIFTCGHQCHFPDCTHILEEDCAVVKAVEKGEISRLRYESYQALMESISETHHRR